MYEFGKDKRKAIMEDIEHKKMMLKKEKKGGTVIHEMYKEIVK